jgi:phospholipase C
VQLALGGAFASPAQAREHEDGETRTPIKHVIVLIGENRTFDHVFATYKPKKGEFVNNLLSKGIVNEDGTPGPNFARSKQFQAVAPFKAQFFISLKNSEKAPYDILPQPTLNFAPTATIFPPGTPAPFLAAIEPSLEIGDVNLLTTGAASGFPQTFVQPDPDTRIANFNTLPNGPFPLKGTNLPYDSFTGDTTHRLFEMWHRTAILPTPRATIRPAA